MEEILTKTKNKVLVLSAKELKTMGLGYCNENGDHKVICDNCNAEISDDELCYYIGVLNEVFCEECYRSRGENMKHYREDERVENRNIENFKCLYFSTVESGIDLSGKKNFFVTDF